MTAEAPLRIAMATNGPPFPAGHGNTIEPVPCPDAAAVTEAIIHGHADLSWLPIGSGPDALTPLAYPADSRLHTWTLLGLRGGSITSPRDLGGHRLALVRAEADRARGLLDQKAGLSGDAFDVVLTTGPDAARDVLRLMLSGAAEAGLVDTAFWDDMMASAQVPKGAFDVIWSSPALPDAAIFSTALATPDQQRLRERLATETGTTWIPLPLTRQEVAP